MNQEPAKAAINTYFSGEAAEMYCILGGGALLAICAALLWVIFNDRFSTALAITLLVVALLLAGTALSLLIRDGQNRQELVVALAGDNPTAIEKILAAEKARMQKVADNYQNLRYTFAAFALMGALLIAFTHHPTTHAIAVGLLIFAMAGAVIDRYSEVRALVYLQDLQRQP